jgi:hypothetical protein
MKRLAPCAAALAAVAIALAGVGRAEGEVLDVFEFSGTFDTIDVPGDGSTFELLGGRITVTAPDTLPEQLTISDLVVDLTGYDDLNGGAVSIVGGSLVINNPSSGTSASLAVDSATLTQVLNAPIGVGYMYLGLSLSSSDLKTVGGDTINLNVVQSIITMNGLRITTDGSNGTAHGGTPASASISAIIPEPSTLVLGLLGVIGCGGYCCCWRARRRS